MEYTTYTWVSMEARWGCCISWNWRTGSCELPAKIKAEANDHGSNTSSLLAKQPFFSVYGDTADPGGTSGESTLCQNAKWVLGPQKIEVLHILPFVMGEMLGCYASFENTWISSQEWTKTDWWQLLLSSWLSLTLYVIHWTPILALYEGSINDACASPPC